MEPTYELSLTTLLGKVTCLHCLILWDIMVCSVYVLLKYSSECCTTASQESFYLLMEVKFFLVHQSHLAVPCAFTIKLKKQKQQQATDGMGGEMQHYLYSCYHQKLLLVVPYCNFILYTTRKIKKGGIF